MCKDNVVDLNARMELESRGHLWHAMREGARRMLHEALEVEVQEYIEQHAHLSDPETGRRLVVRNGYHAERTIQTGLGDMPVKKPRVDDRREGKKFTSSLIPPYMRRSPSVEGLIPALYLAGVSSNKFPQALESILGEGATGLSPNTICRLKKAWQEEYEEWNGRDLTGKKYVYWWVDGIYFNVRLTDERPCLLVIIGTLEDGTKELVGIWDGHRESKLSWMELLMDLKSRGLSEGPKLCVGDGALGFWLAVEEQFPASRRQRCWVHKTANVLDKMPKKLHPSAKAKIHQMQMAETKEDALKAFDEFMELYEAKYPKACECLRKDKEVLFTFYDFPAQHWVHLRTTNPIESTFATVRHRSRQTKGCGSRKATLTMVFKLGREAERRWRKINGYDLVPKVIAGIEFKDGIELTEAA